MEELDLEEDVTLDVVIRLLVVVVSGWVVAEVVT